MTAELALELFEYCARPFLAGFGKNTCIEQVRILSEVLKRLGISTEPMACKLHVSVPSHDFQFFASGDPRDYENAKKLAHRFVSRRNRQDEILGYHTVALVERRIFVDLTLAQVSNEEFRFILDPCMVSFAVTEPFDPPFFDISADATTNTGTPFTVHWIGVEDRSFEKTPAWEPSHLWKLIDMIEQGVWNEWLARRKAG